MARAPAEKVGRGPCPCCAATVTFRRSTGGLMKYACDNCDSTGFAQQGGKAFKDWTAAMHKPEPGEQPKETAPVIPKDSPPPPEKKTANSVFALGNL